MSRFQRGARTATTVAPPVQGARALADPSIERPAKDVIDKQNFGPCRPCSGFGLPCAYTSLPLAQREAVLLGWATGADARMRKVGRERRAAPAG